MYDAYGQYAAAPKPSKMKWIGLGVAVVCLLIVAGAVVWARRAPARVSLVVPRDEASTTAVEPAANDACTSDDCRWGVAARAKDAGLCAAVKDEATRVLCKDGIARDKAFAAGDAKLCKDITDAAARIGCMDALDPVTAANCASRGKSEAECLFTKTLEQALKTGRMADCDAAGDQATGCRDMVGIGDPDQDGLTNAREAKYGSDPLKADTDGDGFKDGDEVKNGYNPNGPGALKE